MRASLLTSAGGCCVASAGHPRLVATMRAGAVKTRCGGVGVAGCTLVGRGMGVSGMAGLTERVAKTRPVPY